MVSVSLAGNPEVQFTAHGSINDVLTFEDAAIDFAGACAIREIFRLFELPYLGLLEQARMSGSLREKGGVLSLEKLTLEAVSEKRAAAGIEGRLELGEPVSAMSPRNIDLTLDIFFPTSDPLEPLLFGRMPEIGPLVGKARLTGSLESFAFENLDVTAGGNGPQWAPEDVVQWTYHGQGDRQGAHLIRCRPCHEHPVRNHIFAGKRLRGRPA
jgi:hypothetical protein